MQVIGPTRQTAEQREYCRRLGIKDIDKIEIKAYPYTVRLGKIVIEVSNNNG